MGLVQLLCEKYSLTYMSRECYDYFLKYFLFKNILKEYIFLFFKNYF
jgi:hypothetical protein